MTRGFQPGAQVKPIALRQQVRRNLERFAKHHLGGSRPLAFTQEGIAMLSSVPRSNRAIHVNVTIMRAFVRLREIIGTNKELADHVAKLEHGIDWTVSAIDVLLKDMNLVRELTGLAAGSQASAKNPADAPLTPRSRRSPLHAHR